MPDLVIAVEDPESPEARWCVQSYFAELAARFEGGFDIKAYGGKGADDMRPPAGLLLVARRDGTAAGCGALLWHQGYAEIKRMWVAPAARGAGLSRQLLAALEAEARNAGHRIVRLDTNRVLKEAQRLYERSGYRAIARYSDNPYAHHWYEKTLAQIPEE